MEKNILAEYLYSILGGSKRAETLVEQRTRELEKINKELLESDTLNKAFLAAIPFGIDIVDEDGNIQFLNKRLEEKVGKLPLAKKCWEVYRDDRTQCSNCPLLKGIIPGETEVIEVSGVFEGKVFQIFHTGMVYKGKKAILEIFQDVTEERKAEDELTNAYFQLRKVDQLKSDFVSMISHELRTPLTAIKEGVDIVMDGTAGSLNPKQGEFLNIAKRNIDRLVRLISSILDFQRIESGKMVFVFAQHDINSLVKEAKENMLPFALSKELDFILELGDDLPLVNFDHDKIMQVLTNLVSNAIKSTDKGGQIKIITTKRDSFVQVSVSDTGIGIASEDIAKLFRQFEQLDVGLERRAGGTGLGLVISKKIIEAHKGKIWADSEFGKGSAFHFILPLIKT